jgi:transposase
VFISIVLEVVKKYEIEVATVHLDSSSFQVQGEYETDSVLSSQQEEPRTVRITYGYSRDHRPDLKQFMMDLICSADGEVSLRKCCLNTKDNKRLNEGFDSSKTPCS